MKLRRVVAVTAVVLALGATAQAIIIPDPTGPLRVAALVRIAAALNRVYRTMEEVNAKVRDTRNRLETMFPNETMAEIRSAFIHARSIQDEIRSLSCQWRFSPRVDRLRLGLLKLGPLCRDQYQRVFGAPLAGPDQDLEEFRQWQGVVRLNMVKESIAVSEDWTQAAYWLGREARKGGRANDPNNPASVGWSMRLLAESEALQLQVAARENATEAMRLAGLQEDLDAERREDWHRQNAALVSLQWLDQYRTTLGRRATAADMAAGMR